MNQNSHRILLPILLVVALLFSAIVPVYAQVQVFTDRSLFLMASAQLTTVDFEGLAPADYTGLPVAVAGATFSSDGIMFVTSPTSFPGTAGFGTGQMLFANNVPPSVTLTVDLPQGVTAVGTDLATIFLFLPDDFHIRLFTGNTFSFDLPKVPGLFFVGFTSKDPISSISFSMDTFIDITPAPVFDNFRFGIIAPEPGSFALLVGLGVSSLLAVRRMRRRR